MLDREKCLIWTCFGLKEKRNIVNISLGSQFYDRVTENEDVIHNNGDII